MGAIARALYQKRLERLVQDTLSRMGLDAIHGTDYATVLMHGEHLVGFIPRCTQHASHMPLKSIDELGRGIENGLQVVLARMLYMKTRRAGTRHLELGGERSADIVCRDLVTMTGHR